MDSYNLVYDTAARRLILVNTPGPDTAKPGRTWRLDPVERTWSKGADIPDTLPNGYPSTGWAAAFDPVTERTWLFADTAMLGYDASADDWVVAERDAGWPASMALAEATNTWTLLLAPSQNPASYGPG